jgi:predicted RNA-binding protein
VAGPNPAAVTVAALVEEQVLRLEVAVDDALLVEVLESEAHLGRVQRTDLLRERALLSQVGE